MSLRRIAVVTTSAGRGGAEKVAFEIAKGLSGAFEFHLLTLGGEEDDLLGRAGETFASVVLLPSGARNTIAAYRGLRDHLSSESFALVHAHLPRAGVLARRAASGLGIPNLYTEHSVARCYHPISRHLNAMTIGSCAHVVAVSNAVAEEVRRRLPMSRVSVVFNAVEVPDTVDEEDKRRAREKMNVSPNEFLVGTVANLRKEKEQEVLLEAFSISRKHGKDLRLVIVGKDLGRGDFLRSRCQKLGLGDSVTFLGHRADAPQLMNGFDLFALSSGHEGLPISMLEAMARSLPVVSTDVGGVSDAVSHGNEGFLVPPRDPSALSKAIDELAASPSLAAKLGAGARRRILSDFRLDRMLARYERLYDSLTRPR